MNDVVGGDAPAGSICESAHADVRDGAADPLLSVGVRLGTFSPVDAVGHDVSASCGGAPVSRPCVPIVDSILSSLSRSAEAMDEGASKEGGVEDEGIHCVGD